MAVAQIANQRFEAAVALDKLRPHPNNPRKGSVPLIADSIDVNGFYGAVIAQQSTGHIIAGEHRWRAAREQELRTVPVIWLDVDDDRALRILLADNRTNDVASYDEEALAELLKGMDDLTGTGWDEEALAELLGDAAPEGPEDPGAQMDRAEELREKWKTERGQIWEIPSSTAAASHRLMCGDGTVSKDVAALLAGSKPHLMVTDPPYGVEYDPKWRADAGVNKNDGKMGAVANDARADWREAWALFPGSVAYVWHAGRFASVVQESLRASGFEVVCQIIWAKDRFALSRGDYHWQHEPCWYAVKKGSKHRWCGARDQSTLWEIPRADDAGHGHGTQKPVECMMRPIQNNSKRGDVVYDPFLGSGTTMVAAEQSGRTCYGMELEPKYCAVILERLSGMGLQPQMLARKEEAQ